MLVDDGMVSDLARDCGCLDKLESAESIGPMAGFLLERSDDKKWVLFIRFFGFFDACDNGFVAVVGGEKDRKRLESIAMNIARQVALPVNRN